MTIFRDVVTDAVRDDVVREAEMIDGILEYSLPLPNGTDLVVAVLDAGDLTVVYHHGGKWYLSNLDDVLCKWYALTWENIF